MSGLVGWWSRTVVPWGMACLGVLLASSAARAQFVGDVFFETPSVVVEEGQVGALDVRAFVGTQPLGAIHIEVLVDPTLLEVDGGGTGQLIAEQRTDNGRAGIIELNGASLTGPIGTVDLGSIVVRPRVSAGVRIPVTLNVRDMIDTDGGRYAAVAGFGGEIVVVAGMAGAAGRSEAGPVESVRAESALGRRALSMRRSGAVVPLRNTDGAVTRVQIVPTGKEGGHGME